MPLYGHSRDSRPLLPAERRVLHGALSRLERCAVKAARTVLKGRGGGDVTLLPDPGTGSSENICGAQDQAALLATVVAPEWA